jgi:pimeloyl-ACP methyl ester carboxylesterase
MTSTSAPERVAGRFIRAGGIDIHYIEKGSGVPLLVLDNAMVSSGPVWASLPFAYAGFVDDLAGHFRVILPDTRGSGRTVHPGGPISHSRLADDAVALIDALGLEQPLITGFSDGGTIATIVGIRHPGSVRAIVNLAGSDTFDPGPAPHSLALTRAMLGGRPDATTADPDEIAAREPLVAGLFQAMEADHDATQGPGHWRTVFELTWQRISRFHGYAYDDLGQVTVPTLFLIGDRDPWCTAADAQRCQHSVQDGELCVLPATDHLITPPAIAATVEFFRRRVVAPSG